MQPEDTSKASTLFELTRAYLFELNDIKKVDEYGKQELELSLKLNFKKGIAYGYLNRAIFYRTIGDFDKAMIFDKKALPIMQEIGNKTGESSCYLNIGLTYSNKGDFKQALEYMMIGVKMKEILLDKKGMAIGYNNIANIHHTQGNYEKSLQYYLKSLKIREEINDKVGMSMAYNNIGNIFKSLNKLDDALGYYVRSLKISEPMNDQMQIGNAYGNIGNIYFDKKNYDQAFDNYFKGLNAKKLVGDKQGIAQALTKIGNVYFQKKEYEQALRYQVNSFELYEKIGDKKGLSDVTGEIGKLYEEKKEYTLALTYYERMLVISNKLDFKEGVRDAFAGKASVYKKLKDFEKALNFITRYNEVKDTLLNKDNFKKIAELNTRYETDKKEKEILLLTKDQQLNTRIIEQQRLVRWGLISGLVLLSVSVFSIYRRYQFKQKANLILEKQKIEIEQKNTLITDSIEYARTIQEAVLPTSQEVHTFLPQSFILYKPKATVSGDFYWLTQINDQLLCAVADCTGHGVPGALMSLLGYNMLENTVKDHQETNPAVILNTLNMEVKKRLAGTEEETKHGMDISFISLNFVSNQLYFAGAHNSIYIIRNRELIELKADKFTIGSRNSEGHRFNNHFQKIKKDDMIYLFTDGFPDQIGGPKRKKFYYTPFKELLIQISTLDPEFQKIKLNEAHLQWKGENMDQTDDILIMGIRIT